MAGISGTGKTKLAQEFARLLPTDDDSPNHKFLSVRPDWRDSKSLLGYHNPLTEIYETSDLIRFILDSTDVEASDLPTWMRMRLETDAPRDWLSRYGALRRLKPCAARLRPAC